MTNQTLPVDDQSIVESPSNKLHSAVTTQEFKKGALLPGTLIGVVLVHVLALAAPFTFTWAGLIAFAVTLVITSTLGVTIGYHRLLTHRSFEAPKGLKYLFSFFACFALQGGPVRWVATHRLHHSATDKLKDPHSPIQGFLWAHMLWVFYENPTLPTKEDLKRYAPDLYDDPVYQFFDKYFAVLYAACGLLFFVAGTLIGGWQLGLSLFIWGFALRTVYTWHATWLVNSATHMWGYRSFTTSENSRNTWWVALLTFGEGWHNNHHAHPQSAKMGFKWFEIDMTYWVIKLLQSVGLAHNVVQPVYNKLPRLVQNDS